MSTDVRLTKRYRKKSTRPKKTPVHAHRQAAAADGQQTGAHPVLNHTPPPTTPPQRARNGNGGMAANLFVRELPATYLRPAPVHSGY
eukprot:scaffold32690_cov107-Isochrysis_galbana.AAC.4